MQSDELHGGLGEDSVLTDSELRSLTRKIHEKILFQFKKASFVKIKIKIKIILKNVFSTKKPFANVKRNPPRGEFKWL